MKKQPTYATEAALCADFIEWVKFTGGKFHHGKQTPIWTPYAETADWDILLVAEDGTQIGVQAKLKFNMKVLMQSVPDWDEWRRSGPDYRAVLVPERDGAQEALCGALGLMMFTPYGGGYRGVKEFSPDLHMEHWNGGWHWWSPEKRCELPEFIPDVVAGASGPVQLTKWKVAALRLAATLELRGYVTRQDFRTLRIDHRRWIGPSGWLKATETPGQFVRGESMNFEQQHPTVYAQVLAEVKAKQEQNLLGEVVP